MNLLAGKVAIITGASKGIGAGIAKAFSAEGASVVVNYSSSKEGADRVLAEIADAGGNAIAIRASVSSPEDVKRLFAETKAAFGRLDILVNNAGVFKFEAFREYLRCGIQSRILYERARADSDHSGGDQTIRVRGWPSHQHQLPCRQPFPAQRNPLFRNEGGRGKSYPGAIGGAWSAGFESMPSRQATPAAKATQAQGLLGEESVKHYISITPLGRLGEPKDTAAVAVFLASDSSSWVTGETIRAGGGAR